MGRPHFSGTLNKPSPQHGTSGLFDQQHLEAQRLGLSGALGTSLVG